MSQIVFFPLTYGTFLGALVLGIWFYKRLSSWKLLDKVVAAVTPIVMVIFGELFVRQILAQPFWPINGGRLAPTFALASGYQLYSPPDSGPVLSTIYGPITALVYLPATLANSPSKAVLVSSLIAAIFFFLPVFWLHIGQNWQKPQRLLFAVYTFIGFCFFVFNSPILNYSAFRIHADAPALGLSALACGTLFFRKHQDSIWVLLLSAIFAVLAVWTKQVTLPIIVALPFYILISDGRRSFIRYVGCLAVSGLVISAIFLAIFNPQYVLFHLLEIPTNQPWTHSNKIIALLGSTRKLLKESVVPISIIIFYSWFQFLFAVNYPHQLRKWFNCNRWSIFAIVGILMIPTSLVGSVKVGGDINAFSFTLYFLAVAVSLIVLQWVSDISFPQNNLINDAVKLLVIILTIAFTVTEIPPPFPTIYRQIQNLSKNSMEIAYQYAKKHPGEAFFPMYPLSSMMAENKMYHFSHGLFDRKISGFLVEEKHFRSYIPENMRFLVGNDKYAREFLPEFSQKVEIEELPGFPVYMQEKK